jgi:uncharacterized protein YerC
LRYILSYILHKLRCIDTSKNMTQISKNPLNKDVFFEIRDDFIWVLADLHNQDDVKSFLYDFFTKTERVMFAKRLAAAMMIRKKFDYKQIQYILHISTSTITRMSVWLDSGGDGLKRVIDRLIQNEKMNIFWAKVNHYIDEYWLHPRVTHYPK